MKRRGMRFLSLCINTLLLSLLLGISFRAVSYAQNKFSYIQNNIVRTDSFVRSYEKVNANSTEADNSRTLWIFFTDKGFTDETELNSEIEKLISNRSPRSLKNRKKVKNPLNFTDLPVYKPYIEQISGRALRIRQLSRWFNAVSIEISADDLSFISSLPFVARIEPVKYHKLSHPPSPIKSKPTLDKRGSSGDIDYGASFAQLDQINVVAAHDSGYTGEGVLIAMFDTGFRVSHGSFSDIVNSGRLIAQMDFVNNDTIVSDEDGEDVQGHGTATWSTAGGFRYGIHVGR